MLEAKIELGKRGVKGLDTHINQIKIQEDLNSKQIGLYQVGQKLILQGAGCKIKGLNIYKSQV